jgi:hypothetical protein
MLQMKATSYLNAVLDQELCTGAVTVHAVPPCMDSTSAVALPSFTRAVARCRRVFVWFPQPELAKPSVQAGLGRSTCAEVLDPTAASACAFKV